MKKNLPVFFILILIVSCKVLSKEESSAVESMAKSMNASAVLPANYVIDYYKITLEARQMEISTTTDPADKITQLDGFIKNKAGTDTIYEKYKAGYDILNIYSALLLSFTSDKYLTAFNKSDSAFNKSIDDLISKYNSSQAKADSIPSSLGGFVELLISKVGSYTVRALQRKYLKQLVDEADPYIQKICQGYINVDNYIAVARIQAAKNEINHVYTLFLTGVQSSVEYGASFQSKKDTGAISISPDDANPYNYFQHYDPIYLRWSNGLSVLEQLSRENLAAFKQVMKSHSKLKDMLDKKSTLAEFSATVGDLGASVAKLKSSYSKFESDLTPKTSK